MALSGGGRPQDGTHGESFVSLRKKISPERFSEFFILNVTKCSCIFIQLWEIPFRYLFNSSHSFQTYKILQSRFHIKDSILQRKGDRVGRGKIHLLSSLTLPYTCGRLTKAQCNRVKPVSFLSSPLKEQSGKHNLNAFLQMTRLSSGHMEKTSSADRTEINCISLRILSLSAT